MLITRIQAPNRRGPKTIRPAATYRAARRLHQKITHRLLKRQKRRPAMKRED